MRKLFTLLFLGFFLLSSCSPAEPGSRTGGSITRAITTEPTTLDPHGAAASGQNVILPYLLDTLVYRDIDNNYQPYLAESWKVSPDGKTITFTLHKGVLFHDGTPLNAAAVQFTYERALAKGSKSPLVSSFANVEKIEAVGEDQVVFTLKRPSSTLFGSLSTAYAGIISPTAVKQSGNQFGLNPVGSGAFKLASWIPGETITLVRNEAYAWGPAVLKNTGAPYLDQLVFKIVPDASTQLSAFQAGEVDVLFVNQPSQIQILSEDASAHQVETTLNSQIYLGFNVKAAPFDNPQVRVAIAHAVNKDELVKLALGGIGKRAFSPLAPTLPGFDPSLASQEPGYDLAQTEALLTAAGYKRQEDGRWKQAASGKLMSLEILTSTRAPNEALATVLQDQLGRAGIPVSIKALESTAASEVAAKGEYQAILWRYDWNDADVLNVYLSTARIGSTNRTFYSNPKLDQILASADAELDDAARNQLYSQAQQILIAEQAWIPLYTPKDYIFMRSTIQGVVLGPMGRMLLTEAWLKQAK
jgi:peptide/nickel transport system substrate-binding protein